MEVGFYFYSACCLLIIFPKALMAIDTISPSESLTDGMTLVSNEGNFVLGFFSPGTSTNRYLGIWFNSIPMQTVVWVANRMSPINDSTGSLKIETSGRIVVQVQNTTAVWSTNASASAQNPVLQLLDTGNLVVRDGNDNNPENYLWQSFDYPADTMLPGMKIGFDLRTGLDRRLTAWKNWDDPSPGDLSYGVELEGSPEMVLRKGLDKISLSGLWVGTGFSGAPTYRANPIFDYNFVWNENEIYYTYFLKDQSAKLMNALNQTESESQITHGTQKLNPGSWFRPKSPERWSSSDFSGGCVHSKPLNCQSGDGFIRADNRQVLEELFLHGYSNLDITRGGSGCVMWIGDLLNIKQLQSEGQDLYVRVSASDAGEPCHHTSNCNWCLFGVSVSCFYIRRCRRKLKGENVNDKENKDENGDMEVAVFEFGTIARATDNFSVDNKLGEGGFGPVYKGTLLNGQEIAVKRLSKSSGQGLTEFKNEVKLIAKLQHRNLVRLLGCCIQGDERMLVYEYMPNRSLDAFIFDQTNRKVLPWHKRFQIICGIARGLLYLHQDSRLRIIHRDLKASNVLLDSEMNPKISDFGMARAFGGDQTEANTNRVVGTYGYMAPEYATDGLFSVKSDVFSFGILMLEVVSGRRNRGFYHANQRGNLIEHAWILWKEGKPSDVADDFLVDTGDLSELLRCIHISLLCVQQHPDERPSMSSVVHMLGSHHELPSPKQPGFLFYKKPFESDSSTDIGGSTSRNEISVTLIEAR
ncbi:G-type lectin S-receptor-like serine/threonine-protein kinase At4g27290 [Hibiscus syriacus]|uniref:G-type lectin S-receptor-like serine/threonine-protein kinase At4g27290 n=1 Tax=Hibiscus syriacus TaxID=106335 RepID=UPI001921DDEA|nr:G-type lectin S-receptor-like serine/threonine-protein kinase At4g27290 [Hibiscus syriacus]